MDEEGGPAWLLPHPVAPPTSATASATSSSPPRRRRRGSTSNNRDAIVTPEPAAYHLWLAAGVLAGFCCASIAPESTFPGAAGVRRSAVIPERVSDVLTAVVEVTVAVVGVKVSVGE